MPYCISTAHLVEVVSVSFCFRLFIFEEFIEKLKAKVKALCARKPLDL